MDHLWNVYLGILISSDLSWLNHIKDVTSKARKQTGDVAQSDTLKLSTLPSYSPIWNMQYLYGIHISAKLLTCWSQSRGSFGKTSSGHSMQEKGLPGAVYKLGCLYFQALQSSSLMLVITILALNTVSHSLHEPFSHSN